MRGSLHLQSRLFELSGALIKENQFIRKTTGRKYFTIDIKPDEVHSKLQNYIYLLTCINCGTRYEGESIRPLDLRMNIHRHGKSGCEISTDHYRNVCKNATFSVQVIEKLLRNG